MNLDPNTLRGDWNYPTTVRFGPGRVSELPQACRALGVSRPLLVTDPGLRALAILQDTLAQCRAAGLAMEVFADVQPNPTGANVVEGVSHLRASGCDGVIAFGGGSALDAGKAIALMVGQHRPIWDFEDREDWWTRVDVSGMVPVVAVPTTAGTGSEVGRAAVVLDELEQTKKIIFHPRMPPALVICDPVLTLGLPPSITAATGMDALAHNLEAYCARGFHPLADGIALEGMRLIETWLPSAVRDGKNLAARAHMLAAATMGATAFQKGLGAVHALSHPVGALFGTHHGLTNGVFLPYVLAFNRPAIDDRLTRLASYLDLPKPSFDSVMDWVLTLRRELGVPHTLAELNVREADVPELGRRAADDPSCGGNPIPVGEPELREMLLMALRGDLG